MTVTTTALTWLGMGLLAVAILLGVERTISFEREFRSILENQQQILNHLDEILAHIDRQGGK